MRQVIDLSGGVHEDSIPFPRSRLPDPRVPRSEVSPEVPPLVLVFKSVCVTVAYVVKQYEVQTDSVSYPAPFASDPDLWVRISGGAGHQVLVLSLSSPPDPPPAEQVQALPGRDSAGRVRRTA